VADCPALTELFIGDAVREKSEKKMFKVTAAVCAPADPVTVKFKGFGVFAESDFTVSVLVWPALIEVGLNVHFAPPPIAEQDREMEEVNELGAAAEMVNVVEAVPMSKTDDVALAERENCGVPLPDSVMACEAPVESPTVSVPVVLPVLVGANVTLTVQLALTLRTAGSVPQVLVCVKPMLATTLVMEMATLPVLVTRAVWATVVVPTTVGGKVRLVGEMVKELGGKVPVPVSVIT
jgi:hypothetical protein